MPWQFTMLLQNVFASVYAIESRALAQSYKKALFQILAVVFGFVYAVFLVYAFLHVGEVNIDQSYTYLPHIISVAVCFTAWTVLTFITFRHVDASVGTLFTALNLVAVVAIASIMLGETLKLVQTLGAGLLMVAIYIIFSARQARRKHHNYFLAGLFSSIASLGFGIAIAGEKFILNHIGAPTYAVVGIGAQFVCLALLAFIYNRNQLKLLKEKVFRKRVIIMGLMRGGAGLLFIISLVSANNASLISMLSGFKIILTTILGAILLKELTFIKRKVLASCIACVGVGLMLW